MRAKQKYPPRTVVVKSRCMNCKAVDTREYLETDSLDHTPMCRKCTGPFNFLTVTRITMRRPGPGPRSTSAKPEVARLRGIAQVAELEAADMLRTVRIAEHALGVIAGYRAQEAEMLAASRAAEALQVIDRRTTSPLHPNRY